MCRGSGKLTRLARFLGHSITLPAARRWAREQAVVPTRSRRAVVPVGGDEMQGARRPHRIPLDDAQVEALPEDVISPTFA